MQKIHQPAMLKETVELLNIQPNQWYLDATFGRGGHTEAILKAGGKVLALDCDQDAIEYGRQALAEPIADTHLILVKSNFIHAEQVMKANHLSRFSGALFDFGASSDQLLAPNRGFSFQHDSALDMRMDQELGVSAADLIQVLSVKQLTNLFRSAGGENQAGVFAKAIKSAPIPIKTTKQLVELIENLNHHKRGKLHPATKVFQALRIAVNCELDNIEQTLPKVSKLVEPKGRMVCLSFHQGEDKIVKTFFAEITKLGQAQLLTPKPLTPSNLEVAQNPRSRSTKLRAIELN